MLHKRSGFVLEGRRPRADTSAPLDPAGGSFNGRTTDSDSVYLGSNPSPPTIFSVSVGSIPALSRGAPAARYFHARSRMLYQAMPICGSQCSAAFLPKM